jgi:hypothetical protein
MLVKVKSKASGNVQCITQKAYNLAKRRYDFLGNCEDGADIYNPDGPAETQQVETQESPNLTTTAPKEDAKVAEAVVSKNKGGRPPKSISSVAASAEK